MKKIIAFILATVMLMATLTACGSKNNDDKKGGAKTAADLKIVLLLPGEINDQGWNASNYAGVVRCVPALIIDLAGQQQNDLQIGSGLGAALLVIVVFAAAGSEGGHQHYSGQDESDNLFHVNPPLNFHTGFRQNGIILL